MASRRGKTKTIRRFGGRKMTKEKIIETIEEKQNAGVWITSISGNTNPDSDLGYSWEYSISDYDDEDGDTVFCINFYHCGNGRGCFGVTETDEYYFEDEADAEMRRIASEPGHGTRIKFSDGSEVISN